MNKEELIIDLIAHPERYSDQQMQEILSDDESLAAYTALFEARMAIDKNSAANVDIDAAWRNFASQNAELLKQHSTVSGTLPSDNTQHNDPKHYFLMKWRKIAAMFVAAVAMSGLAFATIHTLTADRQTHKDGIENVQAAPKAVATANADTASTAKESATEAEPKPVFKKTFENVALGDILKEIAQYHGMAVEFRSQDARALRYYYEWDSANDLNTVIDELNHSEQLAIAIEGNKIIVE